MDNSITFNALILDSQPTGLGVYTQHILDKFLEKNKVSELWCQNVKYIPNSADVEHLSIVESSYSKGRIVRGFQRHETTKKLAKLISAKDDVVLYSPTQHGVSLNGLRQVITVHDVMPLVFPKGRWPQYAYYKLILPRLLEQVESVITVSENTKKDLVKFYNVPLHKINVVPCGHEPPSDTVNKDYSRRHVNEKYGIQNYILMVGIHYRYKNLHSVIRAFANLPGHKHHKLVIVGNHHSKYGKELIGLTHKLNVGDSVVFVDYVSNRDLEHLYRAAKLFVYPSIYEGFGMPPLEAMGNHTLVLASNASSLPEVVGDAAILFDPFDVNDITLKLAYTLEMPDDTHDNFLRRGIENTKRFSWGSSADKIVSILEGTY